MAKIGRNSEQPVLVRPGENVPLDVLDGARIRSLNDWSILHPVAIEFGVAAPLSHLGRVLHPYRPCKLGQFTRSGQQLRPPGYR